MLGEHPKNHSLLLASAAAHTFWVVKVRNTDLFRLNVLSHNLFMIRIFCILSCLLLPPYLFSEEKKYGSLIYNTDIPNTLFLMGDIRNGDSFSLRKALRNHEINTIVLASPGGLVMEGVLKTFMVFL